jgi:energy-coupling factor transport system permease protein
MLINGFFTHFGETVLLRLPASIPLVGGPITAEALLYGALNGIMLTILLAAFTTFTLAVPVRDLIWLIPRALFPVALVTSVALTFLPATLRQAEQIREAQMIRGHRMRRLRDWLPLFLPLLIGGLERSVQLAEAMTVRGLASDVASDRLRYGQIVSILAVGMTASGVVLWIGWAQPTWGSALFIGGCGLLGWRLWYSGPHGRRTVYRRAVWGLGDTAAVLGCVLGALAYWLLSTSSRPYTPYPALTWPQFQPLAGAALLGLLVPALAMRRAGGERQ